MNNDKIFKLELDDATILTTCKCKLEEVYSAFRKFFVENGAKDISGNPKELVFEKTDYEAQKQLYRILDIVLYTLFIYRKYLNYVIQYNGECRFVTDCRITTQAREMARLREKALHDEASALADAKKEGRAEGRAEGISIGEEKAKNKMIAAMKATGFSEEQIQAMIDKMK